MNVNVPAAVGVPVTVPLPPNVRPAGNEPAEMDHVYGAVPPVTVRFCGAYAAPTVPDESAVAVIVGTDAAAMTICSGCVPERFAASVTFTVKLEVPAVVGVPEIVPLLASVKPVGSDPALIDHVYGGVPPLTPRFCGPYFVPAVPPGREVVAIVGGAAAGFTTI